MPTGLSIILLYYCGLSGVISLPSISGFSFLTFLLLSLFYGSLSVIFFFSFSFYSLVFIHRRLKLCACRETGGFTLTYTESPSQDPRSLIFSFLIFVLYVLLDHLIPHSVVVRFVGSHKKVCAWCWFYYRIVTTTTTTIITIITRHGDGLPTPSVPVSQ